MNRFRNLLAVAGLTAGMLLGVRATARADDWNHDQWRDRYEQRAYEGSYWRDRDGRYYRRVWDPYRGWIVERFYPEPRAWERHDNGRHRGWYKHGYRDWHDRDDD
jgi:hypothetical protein